MLKNSFYNIEIDKRDNQSVLVYNTWTSAFGEMEFQYYNKYCSSKEELDEKLIPDNEKNLIDIMRENGFLVDSELDEKKNVLFSHRLNRYSHNELSLTIAPTLDCNMSCKYCYEAKFSNKTIMTLETQASLLIFVEKYFNQYRPLDFTVSWYGGEPLLAIDAIKKLSRDFIDISNKHQVNYSASIITNGIKLDYATAETLNNDCKVQFAQITVDGIGNVHDNRRILKSKGKNFERIIENIHTAMKFFPISIRVNTDIENSIDLVNLIQYFEEKCTFNDNVSYYFAPIEKATDACQIEISTCFNKKEFADINLKLKKLIHEKYSYDAVKLFRPRNFSSSCGATSLGYYVIDPEGYIYNCWDIIGVSSFRIGNVASGITENSKYLKWLMYEIPEKCNECNLLPICNSGCPYKNLFQHNPECESQIYEFKEGLKLIYEQYKSNL